MAKHIGPVMFLDDGVVGWWGGGVEWSGGYMDILTAAREPAFSGRQVI